MKINRGKCNFCNKKTNNYVYGGYEKPTTKFSIQGGFRYPCCPKCWEALRPFVNLPMAIICQLGVFKSKTK